MKKRTQLILLSVFVFIVIAVVLSSSIFSLSSYDIDYMSTTINLNVTKEEIIEISKPEKNKSIFFIDKQTYSKNLENQLPYIKVINIETVFPNKIIYHIAERDELFALKNQDKIYFVDNEGKILCEKSSYTNNANNPIEIITNEQQSYAISSFLEQDSDLVQISYCLKEWKTSTTLIKANIKSIDLTTSTLIINMRSGLTIKIFDFKNELSNKMNLAFSTYDDSDDIKYKKYLEIRTVKQDDGTYKIKGFCA